MLFLFFVRSELIRPGLAVRVDPVQLLYLPLVEGSLETLFHGTFLQVVQTGLHNWGLEELRIQN